MLVLTRRNSESLVIGDDIVIRVFGINGNRVKLGIEAPAGVQVHRTEVIASKLLDQQRSGETPQTSAVVLRAVAELGPR